MSTVAECVSWDDILTRAAKHPRDAALLSNFALCAAEEGGVTLIGRDDDAGAGYLRGNVDVVRATVARLAGRPITVRIEFEGASPTRPPAIGRAHISPEIREHPVVKLVADLFDAAVVDVTPLRRAEASAIDAEVGGAAMSRADSGEPALERETDV